MKTLKFVYTVGLPASGKTTYAKGLLEKDSSFYRVNMDDMRRLFHFSKFSKGNEKFIQSMKYKLIEEIFSEGKNVVNDDTNLRPQMVQIFASKMSDIAQRLGIKIEIEKVDFTHVSFQDCIERDAKRVESVGKDVIMSMYTSFILPKIIAENGVTYDASKKDIIICDLDGTLALLNGRNPYDASNCHEDEINHAVASILRGRDVIFTSGRKEAYREPTLRFLDKVQEKYPFNMVKLIMREDNDNRKDDIVKGEMFIDQIYPYYNVSFVLDDRDQVVHMWRQFGLSCMQVAYGNF